jgi:hypothetical protein
MAKGKEQWRKKDQWQKESVQWQKGESDDTREKKSPKGGADGRGEKR